MKVEIGFAVNSIVEEKPHVAISINDTLVLERVVLNDCGAVNDINAKLQYVTFDYADVPGFHTLKIQGLNILEEFKTSGDFGFQVRRIKFNQIDLEWFDKNSTTYNPVPGPGYVDFLSSQELLDELEYIDGTLFHVKKGNYANYVNLNNGYFEMQFETPLYNWFLAQKFNSMFNALTLRN